MSFEIRKATRQGIRPLIGMYSESGCGKTYSSLMLARGLAGPTGKIVLIDSESGRGELYADVLPGGYDVIALSEPFSPARYIEALEVAEKSGAACVIIDSMSHEWEGPGGILDMAGDNEEKSHKAGLHNWKTPKLEHAKLVQRLLRATAPVVCCIRAKFKSRQKKDAQGKTVIVKDDAPSPIQAEDFIFELTCHGEIMPDHAFRPTKVSHPELAKCLPNGAPITIHHGELLAQWCANPGGNVATKPATVPNIKSLKKQLWNLTASKHGGNIPALQQWLYDEGLIDPNGETLEGLSAERLEQVIKLAKDKIVGV